MNFFQTSVNRFLLIPIWVVSFLFFSKKSEAQTQHHSDSLSTNSKNIVTEAEIKSHLKNQGLKDTHSAMEKLLALKQPRAAIITFNNYVHMDAVQYAQEQHIRVNRDVVF